VLQEGIDRLKESGHENFFGVDSADDLPFGTPDDVVTTAVDGTAYLERKLQAMRAHATQIEVDGPFFALSNNLGQEAWGVEYFVLARGERRDGDARETDLFDGVA
jgi:N-acetyl-1-D-myo-inositol-2-amino-2-deoxy-alpha-D-glucopyranoside deacetylase